MTKKLPPLPPCHFSVHEQGCPIRCINPDLGRYHHFTCRTTIRLGMCPLKPVLDGNEEWHTPWSPNWRCNCALCRRYRICSKLGMKFELMDSVPADHVSLNEGVE